MNALVGGVPPPTRPIPFSLFSFSLLPFPFAQVYAELNHAELSVWEALALLGDLREYEAALWAPVLPPDEVDPDLPLREHAFQVGV